MNDSEIFPEASAQQTEVVPQVAVIGNHGDRQVAVALPDDRTTLVFKRGINVLAADRWGAYVEQHPVVQTLAKAGVLSVEGLGPSSSADLLDPMQTERWLALIAPSQCAESLEWAHQHERAHGQRGRVVSALTSRIQRLTVPR
jgi:hypothetical protein